MVYDQSGHGNDLAYEGPGGVGGNEAHSLYIKQGNAYWHNGSSSGMQPGSQPQGAYVVTSGTHVNGGCRFDYGNSETDRRADGAGAMDVINFGASRWFGGCTGSGPWVTSSGQLTVSVGGSTFCLDSNGQGTSPGTKVIIWSCNGQSNQQWNVNSNGTITGAASGLCLDVTGASAANGALVELWSCNGGSNQQWKLG